MPKLSPLARMRLFPFLPPDPDSKENACPVARFPTLRLGDLIVDDEDSFSHVGLYGDLRALVEASDHRFMVLRSHVRQASWDRAAFLNLTFWHAAEPVDVLVDEHIAADVVGHVGWHLLASRHLAPAKTRGGGLAPATLLLSEAIASAFDMYLVGRLLGHRPESEFLQTQVPTMADVAEGAGMGEEAFEAMLESVSADPERAFEDLRALLFDAAMALYGCSDVEGAAKVLDDLEDRRFAPLLHHYELSNWVLDARAYGAAGDTGEQALGVDRTLREVPVALDWLEKHWVRPEVDRSTEKHPPRRARPR